jgi:L-iditol 2-dehydrogenase
MFFTGPTARYMKPVILGHELSGEIVEIGSRVDSYAIGDLVTLAPLIPCRRCLACSRGQDNLCEQARVIGCTVHGGLAQFLTVPGQMVLAGGVVKLPSDVDFRTAALTELVACCLRGLRHLNTEPCDRILIIGDGPIGLTFVQLARMMGVGCVLTSGRRAHRRKLSEALGADEALDANSVDLQKRFARSLDRVIVATANVDVMAEALQLVRPGGDLLLFSGYRYGTVLTLDVNAVHYQELHLHGSIDCTIRDFRDAMRYLPHLQMHKLISDTFPLGQTREAFYATKGQDAVKILIEP